MQKGYVRKDGYRQINVKINGAWQHALEHRVVMERALGRPLARHEQIHHRDGNKTNNSPDNLELIQNGEHRRRHHVTTFRDATRKQCTRCRETKPRTDFAPVHRGGADPHHTTCKQCLALMKRARAGRPPRLNARLYR